MKCFYCKGDMNPDKTTYFADLGSCIVIVKNVPCYKCDQCGEVSFSGTVAVQLEKITEKLKGALTEIAVVNYSDNVA